MTEGLRVRSKPEVSDASRKYEPLLWDGALAWVIEGPVRGSGYDWYRIAPMGEADLQIHPDPPPEGWVAAASKDGQPWIVDDGHYCPSSPLGTVSEFDWPPQGLIGLSCFGGRELQIVAWASRWEEDCWEGHWGRLIEPVWYRACPVRYVLHAEGGFRQGERTPLFVTMAPDAVMHGSPAITTGRWARVRVTGHYDDPRAGDCTLAEPVGIDLGSPTAEGAIRACRSQFVVTRMARP